MKKLACIISSVLLAFIIAIPVSAQFNIPPSTIRGVYYDTNSSYANSFVYLLSDDVVINKVYDSIYSFYASATSPPTTAFADNYMYAEYDAYIRYSSYNGSGIVDYSTYMFYGSHNRFTATITSSGHSYQR
jgi:hypothetical protein